MKSSLKHSLSQSLTAQYKLLCASNSLYSMIANNYGNFLIVIKYLT